MTKISRNITTNYLTTGVTLTNAGDNPVAIAGGVTIANPSGIGLQSTQSVYWSIGNAAGAEVSGNSFGVSFASAGSFANQGTVSASYSAGRGYTVTNNIFIPLSAGLFLDGGGVTNSAGGLIGAPAVGVALGAAGRVVNAGTINASGVVVKGTTASYSYGFGVALVAGGSVANQAGGTITGAGDGILSAGSIYLLNQPGARIQGGIDGIFVPGAAASIINQGSISGSGYIGLYLAGGGAVTNQAGGIISAYDFGIVVTNSAGSVSNQGVITANGTAHSTGVELFQGGQIGNSGTILSIRNGIIQRGAGSVTNSGIVATDGYSVNVSGAPASLTNSGTIFSADTLAGAGVAVINGGVVTNAAGGVIDGEWIGLQSGKFSSTTPTAASSVTIVNAGTILAADGKGDGAAVWLHGPGVVINTAGGVIGGAVNGRVAGGLLNGLTNGGFGIVAYYQTTVINQGSIGGVTYNAAAYQSGTRGPKQFAFDDTAGSATNTIDNLIEMTPGAKFGGVVLGATGHGSATLELLSGAGTGTIGSFGSVTANATTYQGYLGFGLIELGNGATWRLGGTISSGVTIAFAAGGSGSLTLANPGLMSGTVTGFGLGETLTLAGVTASTGVSLSASGNVLSVLGAGLTLDFDPTQSFTGEIFAEQVVNGQTNIDLSCFAEGSRLRTDQGEIPVERLATGMRAITAEGIAAEIIWIGHRRVDCRSHSDPSVLRPVRIGADAFGPGRPERALRLSPDHAVFAGGVLIPVKHLVNGTTITQPACDEVTYWHVELARHAVIYAESLPCESYLDTGNRRSFANAGRLVRLHADFAAGAHAEAVWESQACARLRIEGAAYNRVVALLHRQAQVLGFATPVMTRRIAVAPRHPVWDLAALLQADWYLAAHPDVAASGLDAAMHYVRFGRSEGRLPCPEAELVRALGMLDPGLVMFTMPDIIAAGDDAVAHFCTTGWQEARRPNPYFDPVWYLDNHAVPPGMNPLLHYLLLGEPRGFWPGRHFDPLWYRDQHGLGATISPLAHYLFHRRRASVSPLAGFDVRVYCRVQGSKLRAGRDVYVHYLAAGSCGARTNALTDAALAA